MAIATLEASRTKRQTEVSIVVRYRVFIWIGNCFWAVRERLLMRADVNHLTLSEQLPMRRLTHVANRLQRAKDKSEPNNQNELKLV
jgi:hypothetical protein